MRLLAYSPDGTQALIQREDGLPYDYRFGETTEGTLVLSPATHLVPEEWIIDFPLGPVDYPTIDELKHYLEGTQTDGYTIDELKHYLEGTQTDG